MFPGEIPTPVVTFAAASAAIAAEISSDDLRIFSPSCRLTRHLSGTAFSGPSVLRYASQFRIGIK
jgi:hypothetical protein